MAYIISVNSNNHTNVSIYFERSNGHFLFETSPSYFAFAKKSYILWKQKCSQYIGFEERKTWNMNFSMGIEVVK